MKTNSGLYYTSDDYAKDKAMREPPLRKIKKCQNCKHYLPCELKMQLPAYDMKYCLAWE